MDGLLSIGRVFQREARCFCRCDGWVSDRRLKLVRWRSDRKSSLLNGHRRPSHQIRRRRRQIQPSQAEFLMFLSKSLNYNGKERLWKTSMSREEGKRKSRITWKRDRTWWCAMMPMIRGLQRHTFALANQKVCHVTSKSFIMQQCTIRKDRPPPAGKSLKG
jgi:hypothetical protein